MVRSRAVVVVTLAATSVLGASVLGWWFGEQRRAADTPYRVVQVLDGDTIVVRIGTRQAGHDPVAGHRHAGNQFIRRKPLQCYGPEASDYTTGGAFYGERPWQKLEDDVEKPRDIYDRRLAYVSIDGAPLQRRAAAEGLRAGC